MPPSPSLAVIRKGTSRVSSTANAQYPARSVGIALKSDGHGSHAQDGPDKSLCANGLELVPPPGLEPGTNGL